MTPTRLLWDVLPIQSHAGQLYFFDIQPGTMPADALLQSTPHAPFIHKNAYLNEETDEPQPANNTTRDQAYHNAANNDE
jgi:hypothetical protein